MKKEGVCGMNAATQRPHIVRRLDHSPGSPAKTLRHEQIAATIITIAQARAIIEATVTSFIEYHQADFNRTQQIVVLYV